MGLFLCRPQTGVELIQNRFHTAQLGILAAQCEQY